MAFASSSTRKLRQKISFEAARIMAEEGVCDFQRAKDKACARLGTRKKQDLPTNYEIESELASRLHMYAGRRTIQLRQEHLDVALEVMELLDGYSPALTGATLSGAITEARPVELHTFAHTPDEVCTVLDRAGVRYRLIDKRIRLPRGGFDFLPTARFVVNQIDVNVFIFPDEASQPALNPVDGRPMKRASLKKVRRMIRDMSGGPDGAAVGTPADR